MTRAPGPIVLEVDGPIVGKGRPRIDTRGKRPRTFTPDATVAAEKRVRAAWLVAGARRLPDGPIHIRVEVVVQRPGAHWRRDGALSASGVRAPLPTSKPDLDNVLKLVADALNDHAYRDDAAICDARVIRRWANPGEDDHLRVTITSAPVPTMLREAA